MTTIQPITPYTPSSTDKRNKTEQVAAGVGGAAGVTATATNMASKKGLLAREQSLQAMMNKVTTTASKVTENVDKATSLWGKFTHNTKVITNDILKKFKALENNKIVGAIFKSPVVKKCATVFGGVLAFFVLVSGINKAAKTAVEAAGDVRHKIDVIRA